MHTLRKLIWLLSPKERRQAARLLLLIIIMALMDVIGVASIMPFIAVLSNPQLLQSNELLNAVYIGLNFESADKFKLTIGIFVFGLFVVSLGFKALATYLQLQFSLKREYTISKQLVEKYLGQQYDWFLNRHSSDLSKSILSEVGTVISYGFTPMALVISQGAVVVFIILFLCFIDIKLALGIGLTLGFAYGVIYMCANRYLGKIGKERAEANAKRFMVVSEVFSAIKQVKLGGFEAAYVDRFDEPAKIYAKHQASALAIGQLPRYALEGVAFGGMLIVILYLMVKGGDFATAIPIISLYAFAGYRLMPALQQIYGAITQLRYVTPTLEALHKDFLRLKEYEHKVFSSDFDFSGPIALKNISYTYPYECKPVVQNLNINILNKSKVGFVGATGSGKTTTADIILGLLLPQRGELEINGKLITNDNRCAWQKVIGYVPQQIQLIDDTITANIAFGISDDQIDHAAVEYAAKIANLHHFVVNVLPSGYSTQVGEGGVRLSGGQRQRIGIARALYHKPKVLIMDEATSALDNLTELDVMEAIHNIEHEITIILIAHRLSTVKNCDQIFMFEAGCVVAVGTFEELNRTNEQFRFMANI